MDATAEDLLLNEYYPAEAERLKEASVTEEFRGKDLDDLLSQFSTKMSGTLDLLSDVTFDVRG